jgi:hypothetical protein
LGIRVVSSFGFSITIPQKGQDGLAMISLPTNLPSMVFVLDRISATESLRHEVL